LPDEARLRSDLQTITRAYRALTYRGGIDADIESQTDLVDEFAIPPQTSITETRKYAYHRKVERNRTAARYAKKFHGNRCQACDESALVHDLPVYDDKNVLTQDKEVRVVIGIGETALRYRIANEIEREFGDRFATFKHPCAWVGDRVPIKTGSVICAGALVTTDISIGAHAHLHVGSKIGHDTIISDFVTVAPGATVSGRVHISAGAFIGAGAVILPDITIGAWSIIGAGAVVTKDVPNDATVVGVPARVISRRKPGWHLTSDRL
jgi:sugar O-acyltransferase (sialic acid O-acetyltransferase NeuD family)